MRHALIFFVGLILFLIPFPGDLAAGELPEGRSLQGVYVGKVAPDRMLPGMEEDAAPQDPPILPLVSDGLRAMMTTLDPAEEIRVIIVLQHQPQTEISRSASERYGAEMEEIRQLLRIINTRYAGNRNLETLRDADNYLDPALILSVEDKEALKTVSEEHEALSLEIRDEIAARLKEEIEADQESVRRDLEKLGGTVEFGTVIINALVARLPVSAIDEAAAIDKVAHISEDVRLEACLTNADNATRVTDMGGLWDAGRTGGTYDPAVIDTGTDLDNPMLEDDAGRDNFYSWYLVGAGADPDYDDVSTEDDLLGHGTHVMGIVASHGSLDYPSHLGMSHGVDKAVTLKAGFRDIYDEGAMKATDCMYLVDRALYETGMLQPFGTFNDDVDGMNLSFGGETSSDITYFSLFFDSVVANYTDLVVTIAAGNEGPSNFWFSDPGCAYNPITVANVDDMNTTTRSDDEIWYTSTRGPTDAGRRKPDISAPGAYIDSCNNNWETEIDHIEMTGTSMAAPMVLGVAMDLMEAGVIDELEIKALLINTAQKNDGDIDFESDDDGWNQYYGWGYMNALAAYHHRTDLFKDTVTPYPQSGHYHLYKGQMRDEGSSGEGRDRATMVWNKYVGYNPQDYPTYWAAISNLNLYLFDEADEILIDSDVATLDNVAQVRVVAGAGTTDVIINALAFDSSFDHPNPTEEFALATEEGFVEVDLPASFAGYGTWPAEVEPNEEFDVTFWLVNNSEIASHNNLYNMQEPAGWSIVSGVDPWSAGSVAGGGGTMNSNTWRLRAQPTPEDNVQVVVNHSHYSYFVEWGPFGWGLPVNVRWDTTPPVPTPTWSTAPYAYSTSEITMSCTSASDLHGPVTYFFDFVFSPTSGAGGTDSGWMTNRGYTDAGLETNHRYSYSVSARDNAQTPNYTPYSTLVYVYTLANQAGQPTVTNPTDHTLDVTINANGNPAHTECAIYIDSWGGSVDEYYLNATGGNNGSTPFFQSIADWGTVTATGLDSDITYGFSVRSRNGDNIETPWSTFGLGTTTATPSDTVGVSLTCIPASGTVPFATQMTLSLDNLYTGQLRRVAGRIHITTAGGGYYANWRVGSTNIAAGESFVTVWNTNIPALGALIGNNQFQAVAVDITPNPYNQPPYPPAGDSDTSTCTVVANSP